MQQLGDTVTNWAGNVRFRAQSFHRPTSVPQLQALVSRSDSMRALGTGHSFSRIADTDGDLISVSALPAAVDIDSATATVRIAAGMRYGEITGQLDAAGFALPNLGSLPHISVAGACATGTHGSGDSNGVLATAVSGVELVTAAGDLVSIARRSDPETFDGSVVSLGSLGIVTALTLDLVPAFEVAQHVYLDLPRQELTDHFDLITAAGYSVSVFMDWRSGDAKQVWIKRRLDGADDVAPDPHWLGATLADRPQHPVPGMPVENCTEQLGVPGRWHNRLPAFRLEFTPSNGDELQSEYLLPREHAVAALAAMDQISDVVAPVLQVGEIRTVAADSLWLSPAYRRDSVALHFTWVANADAVAPAVAAVEAALTPLSARPHWGKVFGLPAEIVGAQFERLEDFIQLAQRFDPKGKLRNEMVDTYLPSG